MSSIYFIRCEVSGLIKIGLSTDPRARLSQLQTASTSALTMLATEPGNLIRERDLHQRFASARVRGEWFSPSADLLAHIKALPAAHVVKRERLTFPGTALTDDDMAAVLGTTRGYATQMRLGMRSVTLEAALTVNAKTGDRIGPLSDAADDEIAILRRFIGAEPFFVAKPEQKVA